MKSDVQFKLAHSLRRRLRNAIINGQKAGQPYKIWGVLLKN